VLYQGSQRVGREGGNQDLAILVRLTGEIRKVGVGFVVHFSFDTQVFIGEHLGDRGVFWSSSIQIDHRIPYFAF
jgi:hypothetical protein